MLFTIFTPTYNRAIFLKSLYLSLLKQTYKNFEWIIVDDGSTDNTSEVVDNFINSKFKIRYYKIQNCGKHMAINYGVSKAIGTLFFIVDSDDILPKNALDICSKVFYSIPKEKEHLFAGICGLKGFISNGNAVGKTYRGEKYLDISSLQREKYDIYGDKAEIYFTSILKRFPFPHFDGEKFMTECVVWDKIAAAGYILRFFNSIVYLCEYLPDGLSSKYFELLIRNPHSWGLYLYQCRKYKKYSFSVILRDYVIFYINERKLFSFFEISRMLHACPFCLFVLFSFAKVLNIYKK